MNPPVFSSTEEQQRAILSGLLVPPCGQSSFFLSSESQHAPFAQLSQFHAPSLLGQDGFYAPEIHLTPDTAARNACMVAPSVYSPMTPIMMQYPGFMVQPSMSSSSQPPTKTPTTLPLSQATKRRPGRPRKYVSSQGILDAQLSKRDAQLRSQLKPPKQYPSAWQLYFNEELQRIKAETPTARLNVAVLAKEAGQRYAKLSDEKKKEYIQRSNDAKEKYERDLALWQSTLTPEDIRQENLFRSAQRRLGKSRRGNMRDPNAPKKPLTAYFLYLKSLRADTVSLKEILQGEHETTKQSVLAAARWRTLSDKEKQPFIDQAKQEKLEYERRRREYEQGLSQSDFIPRTDLLTFTTSDSTSEC